MPGELCEYPFYPSYKMDVLHLYGHQLYQDNAGPGSVCLLKTGSTVDEPVFCELCHISAFFSGRVASQGGELSWKASRAGIWLQGARLNADLCNELPTLHYCWDYLMGIVVLGDIVLEGNRVGSHLSVRRKFISVAPINALAKY